MSEATQQPQISTIKSIVIRVRDLNESRKHYEQLFGLSCISETDTISDDARNFWGLGDGRIRCARFAEPGNAFGMIDLVEWSGGSDEPIRDPLRSWDTGLWTINHKTTNMPRAIESLKQFGATFISEPITYTAGRTITEMMINLPTGERCTMLQIGDAVENEPLFGKAVATFAMIVPSVEKALRFYRDVLGLSVAITLNQSGEPFATLCGAPADTHLDMALLTSAGEWTGKFELIALTPPADADSIRETNSRANGLHNGYWMTSVVAHDLDALAAACRNADIEIVRGPVSIDRPLSGQTRAMIVRAPGGELMECLSD